MGDFAKQGESSDRGALFCSFVSSCPFRAHKSYPFSTLVHQLFYALTPTELVFPRHHCKPSSIICWLFCVSVKLTITRSVPRSCSESIWLDGVTHLPVSFPYVFSEIWNRVTHCGLSLATTPLYTQMDSKRELCCFLNPAPFKDSLDRLGCSWKTLFDQSRGQTHWRGKGGGGQKHVWVLAYNILHLFPFFPSPDYTCIICPLPKTMGLCVVVVSPSILVCWYIIYPSKRL